MSFTLQVFTRVQGSVSIKAARKLTFDYTHIIVGSWKTRFKVFDFNCLWNQEGVAPTFEHAWATTYRRFFEI